MCVTLPGDVVVQNSNTAATAEGAAAGAIPYGNGGEAGGGANGGGEAGEAGYEGWYQDEYGEWYQDPNYAQTSSTSKVILISP